MEKGPITEADVWELAVLRALRDRDENWLPIHAGLLYSLTIEVLKWWDRGLLCGSDHLRTLRILNKKNCVVWVEDAGWVINQRGLDRIAEDKG